MLELIIRRADNSVYWRERFNTQAAAQNWLAEEQTRKYWKPEYTFQIIDHTPPPPPPPTQEEIDAEIQRKAAIANFKQRLKVLAGQADLTAAEVKEAIIKRLKLSVLLKDLD